MEPVQRTEGERLGIAHPGAGPGSSARAARAGAGLMPGGAAAAGAVAGCRAPSALRGIRVSTLPRTPACRKRRSGRKARIARQVGLEAGACFLARGARALCARHKASPRRGRNARVRSVPLHARSETSRDRRPRVASKAPGLEMTERRASPAGRSARRSGFSDPDARLRAPRSGLFPSRAGQVNRGRGAKRLATGAPVSCAGAPGWRPATTAPGFRCAPPPAPAPQARRAAKPASPAWSAAGSHVRAPAVSARRDRRR